jgi:hypothetical protein
MNKKAVCILGLARLLGWPHGVIIEHTRKSGVPFVLPGGETGWRAWIAENADSDDTAGVSATLKWAKRMMDVGKDPGPPESWDNKARLSSAALMGMDAEAEDNLDPSCWDR